MIDWQPISTAPRDGTTVLLTDGSSVTVGLYVITIELDETFLGYDEGCRYPDGSLKIGLHFADRVPNPKAGQVSNEYWTWIGGLSAFSYDEANADTFDPTYWAHIQRPDT